MIKKERPSVVVASFSWPQSLPIVIDFDSTLIKQQAFFNQFDLPVPDADQMRSIWRKHYSAIQREVAILGYDRLLMIPKGLPPLPELWQVMARGFEPTWQGRNFQDGGSFASVRNASSRDSSSRLVLVHGVKELDQHPVLKATLGLSPMVLTGKSRQQIETIIRRGGNLVINFQPSGTSTLIKAQGLTLDEYAIFQRQWLTEGDGHLDSDYWSWLLSSYSASRLALSYWSPGSRQLDVSAGDAGGALDNLGCRLSRSFK
ncbi:MAG: hypothetical protein WC517_02905 [Patescibacteria group bacterium]